MPPKKLYAAILSLSALTACATPAPLRIVDSSCLSFKAISYAQLPVGVADDLGNKADSDLTVAEIEGFNARWEALCRKP